MFRPCALVAVLVSIASAAVRADEFPYTATVNADDVYVRGGPGKSYYPTDKLRRGTKVEVYRHDPGGWLAIRPPAGSFSWVSARHLEQSEDSLAKVSGERVVARIGSVLSDRRDVIQVRLERGEVVELVDGSDKKDAPWRKIAPPSGEFRWISAKFIEGGSAAKATERAANLYEPRHFGRQALAEEAGGSSTRWKAAPPATEGGPEVFRPANSPTVSNKPNKRAAFVSPVESRGSVPAAGGSIRQQVEEIDLALSELAVGEESSWDVEPLRAQAEELLAASTTAVDRGRCRLLLRKIDRFIDIQQRQVLASGNPATPPASGPGAPGLAAGSARQPLSTVAPAQDGLAQAAASGQYDGVGQLRPVATRTVGDPPYALVDAAGQVQAYLVASPGVNLRTHQGQLVGVNGTRAFLLSAQKPLLSVRRVTVLDPGQQRTARTASAFSRLQ